MMKYAMGSEMVSPGLATRTASRTTPDIAGDAPLDGSAHNFQQDNASRITRPKKKKKSVRWRDHHGEELEQMKFFFRNDLDPWGVGEEIDEGCAIPWRKPEMVFFSDREQQLLLRIDFHKVITLRDKHKMKEGATLFYRDGSSGPSESADIEGVKAAGYMAVEVPTVISFDVVDNQQGNQQSYYGHQPFADNSDRRSLTRDINPGHEYYRTSSLDERMRRSVGRTRIVQKNVKFPHIKCIYHMQGNCRRGADCFYSHDL